MCTKQQCDWMMNVLRDEICFITVCPIIGGDGGGGDFLQPEKPTTINLDKNVNWGGGFREKAINCFGNWHNWWWWWCSMVGGLDDWRQFDQIECNQTFHTVANMLSGRLAINGYRPQTQLKWQMEMSGKDGNICSVKSSLEIIVDNSFNSIPFPHPLSLTTTTTIEE